MRIRDTDSTTLSNWCYSEPRVKVNNEWIGWLVVYARVNDEWTLIADHSTWSLYYLLWDDNNFWEGV